MAKRKERREEAQKALEKAEEAGRLFQISSMLKSVDKLLRELNYNLNIQLILGDEENVEKFNKRLVKVSKQHNDDCKTLLKLMGVPYIEVS